VRLVLVETLLAGGYRVLEASDGASALEVARKSAVPIELLCTDGIMPGMATRELIDEFRVLFPRSPVLVCSGHVEEELVRRRIASGEFAFLPKPFSPDELVRRVQELLAAAVA
jgi:CheY-like chemotaxis protein